jgi:hypothetical protein
MVHTSKKHFRQDGMSPSLLTCYIRAIHDTLVADHSTPGHQFHASLCISPSDCSLTISSRCVGLLFTTHILAF